MLIVGWEVLVVKSCVLGTQARGQFFYYANQPEAGKLLIYLFLSLSQLSFVAVEVFCTHVARAFRDRGQK